MKLPETPRAPRPPRAPWPGAPPAPLREGQRPLSAGGALRPGHAGPRLPVSARRLALPGLLVLAALGAVAARAAFVGSYLANWDSVQYALGLVDFDVVRHQPHPPGSILYIVLARLALRLAGEANLALSWISVVASAVSVALCYVVGREMFGHRIALVATVLYFASPLSAYYGSVALPYSFEGALGLAAVGLCWHAAENRSPRAAIAAAAVLAIAGGVRQTTMLLLLPLWAYAAWQVDRAPGRATGAPAAAGGNGAAADHQPDLHEAQVSLQPSGRVAGVMRAARQSLSWRLSPTLWLGLAVMGCLTLAWAIPLIVWSGGPVKYVTASRQLSSLVSSLSSVFARGLPAAATNVGYIWGVGVVGLNLAAALFAVYLLPGVEWPWRPNQQQRRFLWLWAGPPLLVFSVMHIGQAGYVLLIWPLACYAAATAALTAAGLVARRWGLREDRAERRVVGTLALVSAILFLFSPLVGSGPIGLSARQIRQTDRYWHGVTEMVRDLPPDETVLLTGVLTTEGFRHASYYLPEYRVFAVGFDREETLGVVIQGYQRQHTYAWFMAKGSAVLRQPLPPGTKRLVILDEPIARLFPAGSLEARKITGKRYVWLWPAIPRDQELRLLTVPTYISVD